MGMSESPPPTIVQLRAKLAGLILDPATLMDPTSMQLALDECVLMCDWLMQQHPSLTAKYFLRLREESRGNPPDRAD